ncbi:MAG: hypothetical protein QW503_02250 [Sulfolobales archaeon]
MAEEESTCRDVDKLAEAYAWVFTVMLSKILRYLVEAYKRFLADQADALALYTLSKVLDQEDVDYWGE